MSNWEVRASQSSLVVAVMMVLGPGRVRVHVEVALAVGSIVEQPVTTAADSKTSVVRWAVEVRREASP
jgi:hypothetical protein